MKIIITESKLENTVLKFLDSSNFVINDNGKTFNAYIYFLNNEGDNEAMISVYYRNAFGEVRNFVYVNPKLIDYVTSFLPISEENFLNIVLYWVSDVLNMKMSSIENAGSAHQRHRIYVYR